MRTSGTAKGIVVAVALAALALADGGYGDLVVGIAAALIWFVLAGAALGGLLDPIEPPRPLVAAGLALAGLVALTGLSLAWASDPGSGFVDVVRIAGYLGAFLLVGLAARRGEAGSFLVAIAAVGVGIALVALASRLLGLGPGDARLAAVQPTSGGRLSYPIGYWNALGSLMAVTLPVIVWLAAEARSSGSRRLAVASVPPVLLAAYMTSSRGALLAALIGLAIVIACASRPGSSLASSAVGVVATLPAIAVATAADGILVNPGDGLGSEELAVTAALLAGMLGALSAGPRIVGALARIRLPRTGLPGPAVAGILLAAGVALVLAVGPSTLVGSFGQTAVEGGPANRPGLVSASGSGRAQFWEVATEAFAEQPARGIGAGGYPAFWNENGSLPTPARNAHSEPLELLAELGLPGFLLFAAFFSIVIGSGLARLKGPDRAMVGAALAPLIAGLVGVCIDWTWNVPAVALPVVLAAGLLAGPALARPEEMEATTGSRVHAVGSSGLRVPTPLAALLLIAMAVPAIWAGGVLFVASSQLDVSRSALERGDLEAAAAGARAAAAIEPWAAEPWLQIATVERAAGNLSAARVAAAAAIARSPDAFRPWLLASEIASETGDAEASSAYAQRADQLAPLVIERAARAPAA